MALLNERFDIDPERPMPQCDGPYAKAYAVRQRGNNPGTLPMMALVCEGCLPVRGDYVTAFRGVSDHGLMHVVDSGVVFWPLTGRRHYAFVYDTTLTLRLAPMDHQASYAPLKENDAIAQLIKPIGNALSNLDKANIFHGAVRASNVFLTATEPAILGDCLAAPLGYEQPCVYETIERGMAPALARGAGTSADDFYAFGVLILSALIGEMPLRELSDESIIQLKLERGSYLAIAGERRFGNGITELLRGLLADDPKQRWGMKDFDMWLSGRRLTPRQSLPAKRASRPLRFGAHDYVQVRQLMAAFATDTKLAAKLIQNGEFERWISHALNDDEAAKAVKDSLEAVKRMRTGPEEERIVGCVLIAMDPKGPMRYRGLSIFPQGLATLLVDMALKNIPMHLVSELIFNNFAAIWLSFQSEKPPDMIVTSQLLDHAKAALEKNGLGFGMERAMYELNPLLPCLSTVLREDYVINIRQLLEAFNRRTLQGLGAKQLMDRHIAAFILMRDKKVAPAMMREIEQAGNATASGVALITLYAELQYRHGPNELKGMAQALLPAAEEAAKRFHLRGRQEKTKKDLKTTSASGNIVAMLNLIDDPDLLQRDVEEFKAATFLYEETEFEIARLQTQGKNKKALAEMAGQPVAATCAVTLAFLLLIFLGLRTFLF